MSVLEASKYKVGDLSRKISVVGDREEKFVSLSVKSFTDNYILAGHTTLLTQKEAYELAVNIIQSANACNQED